MNSKLASQRSNECRFSPCVDRPLVAEWCKIHGLRSALSGGLNVDFRAQKDLDINQSVMAALANFTK